MDDANIGQLANLGMIGFIALSAYLVLLAGEISFGQQAFFAIGAYGAGIATTLWNLSLSGGLAVGALAAAAAGLCLGLPTLRLRGMHFAIATLAFAEVVRILFQLFHYRMERDGSEIGPDGTNGFNGIRYVFENDLSAMQMLALIWGLLGTVLVGLVQIERSRLGAVLRLVGRDPILAASIGANVTAFRLGAVMAAGALAGLGGGLYAHLNTYVEPALFDVMLGVHALAYGLIGGLGTPFGPLLGAALDVGLLESTRLFAGYRMIVFGGLVAAILIVRPRGILDERTLHWLGQALKRRSS
jgi:branched-chain amino acid transport system permease protein